MASFKRNIHFGAITKPNSNIQSPGKFYPVHHSRFGIRFQVNIGQGCASLFLAMHVMNAYMVTTGNTESAVLKIFSRILLIRPLTLVSFQYL